MGGETARVQMLRVEKTDGIPWFCIDGIPMVLYAFLQELLENEMENNDFDT